MRPPRRQLSPFTRAWPVGRHPVTNLLVVLTVALATAQALFVLLEHTDSFRQEPLGEWLGLSAEGVRNGRFWQFISFPIMHAGLPALLGSLLALFFAGREVEPILGRRHLVALYAAGLLAGGVAHWLADVAGLSVSEAPLLGIAAGVAAVLIAWTTILPELEITLMLFFVVPLKVRAKWLAFATVAGMVALLYWNGAPSLSPVAVLAGCAVGWIHVKQLGYGNPLRVQRWVFARRVRAARLERMPAEQFIHEEIDPILEKISRKGIGALTRGEKKVLDRGREKIAGRKP